MKGKTRFSIGLKSILHSCILDFNEIETEIEEH